MELKIVVCDDEAQQTQYMELLANKWAAACPIQAAVGRFDSAEGFKDTWKSGKAYDILLLDIKMGGQNEVELAKEIHGTDEKPVIIFITALPDFMQEGYDVSALHYLMKPVSVDKLNAVLGKAARRLRKDNAILLLPSDNGNVKVSTDEILYIESFDHFLEVKTIQGTVNVKMPLYMSLKEKLVIVLYAATVHTGSI